MSEFDTELTLSRRIDAARIASIAQQATATNPTRQAQSTPTSVDTSGYWNDDTGSFNLFFTFGVSKFGGADVLK